MTDDMMLFGYVLAARGPAKRRADPSVYRPTDEIPVRNRFSPARIVHQRIVHQMAGIEKPPGSFPPRGGVRP